MFTAENIDAFISIAIGLAIVLVGYRKHCNPQLPLPEDMTKSPGQKASSAQIMMVVGCMVALLGAVRMLMR